MTQTQADDIEVAELEAENSRLRARDELGRDAIDYVGKIASRLGIDDPADVRRGRYFLERVGEAVLAEIERLRPAGGSS